MDSELIPPGVKRTKAPEFLLWLLPWLIMIGLGALSAGVCLVFGLSRTNMNDYFPFGLWICFDLSIIALGAGAFFTGFLTYIVGKKELKSIINLAVIVGFICYTGGGGRVEHRNRAADP